MIHTVSVANTDCGLSWNNRAAEAGQEQAVSDEPLSRARALNWTQRWHGLFVISSCRFESHQDPYQQVFPDNRRHITLNGISFLKQFSVLWSTCEGQTRSWMQFDLKEPGMRAKGKRLHNTWLRMHELRASPICKYSRCSRGDISGGNLQVQTGGRHFQTDLIYWSLQTETEQKVRLLCTGC